MGGRYHAADLAALFGPVPPSVTAIGWSAQSLWLLVIWGYWLDRHRAPVRRPGYS